MSANSGIGADNMDMNFNKMSVLEKFALEYIKYPHLHKSYLGTRKKERFQAYVSMACGLQLNASVMQMARITSRFRTRFTGKLRGYVKAAVHRGIPSERALDLAPAWIAKVEKKLNMLPKVLWSMDSGRAAGVRSVPVDPGVVIDTLIQRAQQLRTVDSARVCEPIHSPACSRDVLEMIWDRLKSVALKKLQLVLSMGDSPAGVPEAATMARVDWRLVDLTLLYTDVDDHPIVTEDSVSLYEQLQPLVVVFHLVQQYALEEPAPPDELARRWTRAHDAYADRGASVSLVALQRRWYELKLQARCRIAAYWRDEHDALQPLPIHTAIARRFPHVVTASMPRWSELVEAGRIIIVPLTYPEHNGATETNQPLEQGETFNDKNIEQEDDLILIENVVETVELDDDEDCYNEIDNNPVTDVPTLYGEDKRKTFSGQEPGMDRDNPIDKKIKVEPHDFRSNLKQRTKLFCKKLEQELVKQLEDINQHQDTDNGIGIDALKQINPDNVQTMVIFSDDDDGPVAHLSPCAVKRQFPVTSSDSELQSGVSTEIEPKAESMEQIECKKPKLEGVSGGIRSRIVFMDDLITEVDNSDSDHGDSESCSVSDTENNTCEENEDTAYGGVDPKLLMDTRVGLVKFDKTQSWQICSIGNNSIDVNEFNLAELRVLSEEDEKRFAVDQIKATVKKLSNESAQAKFKLVKNIQNARSLGSILESVAKTPLSTDHISALANNIMTGNLVYIQAKCDYEVKTLAKAMEVLTEVLVRNNDRATNDFDPRAIIVPGTSFNHDVKCKIQKAVLVLLNLSIKNVVLKDSTMSNVKKSVFVKAVKAIDRLIVTFEKLGEFGSANEIELQNKAVNQTGDELVEPKEVTELTTDSDDVGAPRADPKTHAAHFMPYGVRAPKKTHSRASKALNWCFSEDGKLLNNKEDEPMGNCNTMEMIVEHASVEEMRLEPEPKTEVESETEPEIKRVAKKVELPDIHEVRRINKNILTAQVAPISVDSKPDDDAKSGEDPDSVRTSRAVSPVTSDTESFGTLSVERTPTQVELDKILGELAERAKYSACEGKSSRYCCLARRHRAVNDAKRRIAIRAGRQPAVLDLHNAKHRESCTCCCLYLLEQTYSSDTIAADQRDAMRVIQSLLSPQPTMEEMKAQLEHNKKEEEKLKEYYSKKRESQMKRKERNEKRKLLEKNERPEPPKLYNTRSRKKNQEEITKAGDDYQEWIRQKNLNNRYFGSKTSEKKDKNNQKGSGKTGDLMQNDGNNVQMSSDNIKNDFDRSNQNPQQNNIKKIASDNNDETTINKNTFEKNHTDDFVMQKQKDNSIDMVNRESCSDIQNDVDEQKGNAIAGEKQNDDPNCGDLKKINDIIEDDSDDDVLIIDDDNNQTEKATDPSLKKIDIEIPPVVNIGAVQESRMTLTVDTYDIVKNKRQEIVEMKPMNNLRSLQFFKCRVVSGSNMPPPYLFKRTKVLANHNLRSLLKASNLPEAEDPLATATGPEHNTFGCDVTKNVNQISTSGGAIAVCKINSVTTEANINNTKPSSNDDSDDATSSVCSIGSAGITANTPAYVPIPVSLITRPSMPGGIEGLLSLKISPIKTTSHTSEAAVSIQASPVRSDCITTIPVLELLPPATSSKSTASATVPILMPIIPTACVTSTNSTKQVSVSPGTIAYSTSATSSTHVPPTSSDTTVKSTTSTTTPILQPVLHPASVNSQITATTPTHVSTSLTTIVSSGTDKSMNLLISPPLPSSVNSVGATLPTLTPEPPATSINCITKTTQAPAMSVVSTTTTTPTVVSTPTTADSTNTATIPTSVDFVANATPPTQSPVSPVKIIRVVPVSKMLKSPPQIASSLLKARCDVGTATGSESSGTKSSDNSISEDGEVKGVFCYDGSGHGSPLVKMHQTMLAPMKYAAPPTTRISVPVFIKGKDPTNMKIICKDANTRMWLLAGECVVVTEDPYDLEFKTPMYYTMEPLHKALRVMLEEYTLQKPVSVCGGAKSSKSSSVLSAPQRVCLEKKLYQKMSNAPLIYAQVYCVVGALSECRRLMMSNAIMYLFNVYRGTLLPVTRQTGGSPRLLGLRCEDTPAMQHLVQLFNALPQQPGLRRAAVPPGGRQAPPRSAGRRRRADIQMVLNTVHSRPTELIQIDESDDE